MGRISTEHSGPLRRAGGSVTNCHDIRWISPDPMKMGDLGRGDRPMQGYFQRKLVSGPAMSATIAASPSRNTQGLQGLAPGNQLIEHLVHRFLVVRSRLEVGVILEVGEERKCDLIAH